MTIEEAWLFWMKTNRSTTEPPTVEDFDVIKKSSHWAAFEAGWHAANSNNEIWNQAYGMGLGAGKEMNARPVVHAVRCTYPQCQATNGCVGACSKTEPVHASDISQERVDETAKRKHEWVGLDGDIPGLGLVTEEFYNGMLCAEDILRKKNT